MPNLHLQRCFNHADREAVARCPECGRCFCRECVSEHADRLLCSKCLAALARQPLIRGGVWRQAGQLLHMFLGLLIAWLFFHWTAALLMRVPSDFHAATLWKGGWLDQP